MYLETLNAKILDQDIKIIHEKMFGRTNKNNQDLKASIRRLKELKEFDST